jgi:hypothetical protein
LPAALAYFNKENPKMKKSGCISGKIKMSERALGRSSVTFYDDKYHWYLTALGCMIFMMQVGLP